MSGSLGERLNKILPRVISDEFLSGSGIGNEIAFYIFDYPPEDELRVRDFLRTLLHHIPMQRHGMRVKHIDLFDFMLDQESRWCIQRERPARRAHDRCHYASGNASGDVSGNSLISRTSTFSPDR